MNVTFYLLFIILIVLFSSVYSTYEQCCKDLGVPELCYPTLCNPTLIPKVITRYHLFEKHNCQNYLLPISKCIANGRDVSKCCYKKSYDNEFDYCFGLCNGTMKYDTTKKSAFKSCFVLNVPAIFPCLEDSYSAAPSEPQYLEIVSKTENTVNIQWKEPSDQPELVHFYKIYLIERKEGREYTSTYDTKDLEFLLDDLETTSSYSVHIVAFGEEFENNSDWYKSRRSNVILFTTSDEIVISQEELKLPSITSSISIPCRLTEIVGFDLDVQWVKVTTSGNELLEDNSKHQIVTYAPKTERNIVLSSLQINQFTRKDFATYRCYIKDTRIEYSETTLTEFVYSEQAPADNPPDTLIECCQKGVKSDDCASLCNQGPVSQSVIVRPGLLVPTPAKCVQEIDTLFKCTLTHVNSAGCCIQAQIPYHCMGMCDTRFDVTSFKLKTCQKWMRKVYECQFDLMNLKPEAVSFVKTVNVYSDTYRFTWDKALDAKVYHIYTRKDGGSWTSRVTVDHAVDITDSDEVVLISVNEFGTSQQHRLFYDSNTWHTVDHW